MKSSLARKHGWSFFFKCLYVCVQSSDLLLFPHFLSILSGPLAEFLSFFFFISECMHFRLMFDFFFRCVSFCFSSESSPLKIINQGDVDHLPFLLMDYLRGMSQSHHD